MTTPKIAVIGAGPVGCTLARILSLSNIPVTVFESDASPNYRKQGGSLDLHPKTGLQAIKTAQLWDGYSKDARFDSQYMLICDKDLKPFIEVGKTGNSVSQRPEIDRAQLRKLLTESLPEGTIKWGHKLKRVEDGGRLVFQHTTESGFDLIIGCDGAYSKVRNYLSEERPLQYSKIAYHSFTILDADTAAPDVCKVLNSGNIFAHGNGWQYSVQQMSGNVVKVGYTAVKPEDWIKTLGEKDKMDSEARKKLLLEEMIDWAPQLKTALEKTQGSFEASNLYTLPVGWHWSHHRGVTAIGDAAHVMLPFAGEGVNLGMDDAQKLAAAIIKSVQGRDSTDAFDSRIAAFEKEMFKRMEVFQEVTAQITKLWLFTEGDMRKVVPEVMSSHLKLNLPGVLQLPTKALIHTWWFFENVFSK
ncbi:putative oligopeptide transporter [Xylariaceae sp. FL0255]|nr:putative oligopeptide transporter [Xylariaceae sp. FL0255]